MSNIGPKEKVSKQRRNTRHAANSKLSMPSIVVCPQCHEMKVAHKVCPKCGYYDGKQVIVIEDKSKKE